jgi:GNAT superfamily N-acetyltransferase
MAMNFSTASLKDIPLIRELAEKTWWPTYGPLQPKEKIEYLLKTFYSQEALAKVISHGEQEFILVDDDETAKGFASYGSLPQKPGVIKIHKLYVLPATHGKGYGRGLLEEIKRRARGLLGLGTKCQLELNVYRGNPALKFYEKMGFSIIGEVNEPVGEFFFEDYVMRLTLDQ